MGCKSVEVFWFLLYWLVRCSVVSTHSTGRFGLGQGQMVLAQGMRDGWYVEVFPVLVLGGSLSLSLAR